MLSKYLSLHLAVGVGVIVTGTRLEAIRLSIGIVVAFGARDRACRALHLSADGEGTAVLAALAYGSVVLPPDRKGAGWWGNSRDRRRSCRRGWYCHPSLTCHCRYWTVSGVN
jgi:hypothetical protein